MKAKLQTIDIKTVLIVLLVAVSFAHVGLLFGDREAEGRAIVGYLLALAIDGVLAISLYEIAGAQKPEHKRLALGGFLVASIISGAFNVAYYRKYHPQDPFLLSVLLGITAPLLAAFLATLKSLGDVERTEAQSNLELEKMRLQLEMEAQKDIALAKEKTKQSKELTKRREMVKAEKDRKRLEVSQKRVEEQQQKLAGLEKELVVLRILSEDPSISQEAIAQRIERSQRTVSTYMKTLEGVGAIERGNGEGVIVKWDVAA